MPTTQIVPPPDDALLPAGSRMVLLKLSDEIVSLMHAHPSDMYIENDQLLVGGQVFGLQAAPETQAMDVARRSRDGGEMSIVGRVQEKWTVRRELVAAKQSEIRQRSQEAERERLARKYAKQFHPFNRTVALDAPPAVGKKGGTAARQPSMRPPAVSSPRASALSSRQAQESLSGMLHGAALQGESVNAKVSALLAQGPLKLKDIQARVHRKSSAIEEALNEVGKHQSCLDRRARPEHRAVSLEAQEAVCQEHAFDRRAASGKVQHALPSISRKARSVPKGRRRTAPT